MLTGRERDRERERERERERLLPACLLAFLREDVITYFVWKCLSPKKGARSAFIKGEGSRTKNEKWHSSQQF